MRDVGTLFKRFTEHDPPRFNAGIRCDMKVGPCACGAWHEEKMPDITKCRGESCISREFCWRYKAPSSGERQSWFAGNPGTSTDDCQEFWPMEDRDPPTPPGGGWGTTEMGEVKHFIVEGNRTALCKTRPTRWPSYVEELRVCMRCRRRLEKMSEDSLRGSLQ